MARSTFSGPILSGQNRFGPLRDIGYSVLEQDAYIDFSVTTGSGTAGYAGGSGQFVVSNTIPNLPGQLYTPQAGVAAAAPTTASPPADTATNIYRGVIMYLPQNCQIFDFIVDMPTAMSGITATPTGVNLYISNGITANGGTPTYASVALGTTTTGTAGRQTVTYSATQLNNLLSTTLDIQNPQNGTQPAWFSQLVFTVGIAAASGLTAPTAGQFNFVVRYVQPDLNIGNTTTYPYGNFD